MSLTPTVRRLGALAVLVATVAACGASGAASTEPSAAPSTGASTAPSAAATGWSFTDGSGKTVELDAVPTRIIAHAYAAAALMEHGITPVGVYADGPIAQDVGLQGVDFSGVEILGEEWGKIDVEKAATLAPDLIVADYWPVEDGYSGMEDGVEEASKKLAELAPVVGASQGDSIVDLIEGYAALAASLGADVEAGTGAKAKADFEAALAAFKTAVKAKPGLTALAISPYGDTYAVAVPAYAPELNDFRSWGLDVIVPETPDPEFPYWQSFSFETADTYQPDLLLFDDRNYPGNLEVLEAQPIANSIKAYTAGAMTTWPAYWLHTYGDYAEQLTRLTEVIEASDPGIGD